MGDVGGAVASGKRRYARCTCVRSQAINRSDYPPRPHTSQPLLGGVLPEACRVHYGDLLYSRATSPAYLHVLGCWPATPGLS